MFDKVLIAEDHETTNLSVQKTLDDLGIKHADYVFYCDDALTRIKKGMQQNDPYDLLITDLSFEDDHNKQQIQGGAALITAVRKLQPGLKLIVFSAESKIAVVDRLFKDLLINGYVRKARNDAKDLKMAINAVYKNQRYISGNLRRTAQEKNAYEFTEFDIIIISQLSGGTPQKDIPQYLQQHKIRPPD